MKKIFALALAIVMMMAIALPVFAEEEATLESYPFGDVDEVGAPQNTTIPDSMELEYGVSQTYTIIIPEDISFTSTTLKDNVRNVAATDVVIAGNEKLEVSLRSLNGWTMKDYTTVDGEGNPTGPSTAVNYWFSKTAGTVFAADAEQFTYDDATNDPVLTVAVATGNVSPEGSEGNVDLYFSTRGTAQEGIYKDYLTFVVDVVLAA